MFLCVKDKIYLNDKIILRRTPETIPFVETVITHTVVVQYYIRCTHSCRRRQRVFAAFGEQMHTRIPLGLFLFFFFHWNATAENSTSPQSYIVTISYTWRRRTARNTPLGMEIRSFSYSIMCTMIRDRPTYQNNIIIIEPMFACNILIVSFAKHTWSFPSGWATRENTRRSVSIML